MNIVALTGRLTQDPELRYTPNGTPTTRFGLAINSRRGETEHVDYFDIETWGGTAKAVAEHIGKGRRVAVAGELRQHRWTDKEENRRSRVVIVARNVEFLDWPGRDNQTDDTDGEAPADAFDDGDPALDRAFEEPF